MEVTGPAPDIRRRSIAALAAVAVVAAASVALWTRPDHFERARALAADEEKFATPSSSALTLARISDELYAAGRACARDSDAGRPRCAALIGGSAFAQLAAANAASCNLDVVEETRRELVAYLDLVDGESARRIEPPHPPSC